MSLQPSLSNSGKPPLSLENNPAIQLKAEESLCLYPYISATNDLSFFRFQAMKLMQAVQMKLQQNFHAIKAEPAPKCESSDEDTTKYTNVSECEDVNGNIIKHTKLEIPKQEFYSIQQGYEPLPEPRPQTSLKLEVQKMLRFLLANMGKNNQALLQSVRNHYLQNPPLLEVYDKIIMKYYSAKKCKEDLIRYILRKAFRSIRTSIMKNEKVNSKKATLLLCKRYFKPDTEVIDAENEDELLESMMPYHKNSKNKTMNINFVLEIFTSESFYREYLQFLPTFNGVLIEENGKKEEKLVEFVVQCIQENCISKIGTLRRLPWIDVWIEDAKNLAIAIMPNKRLVYNCKKAEI